MEYLQLWHDFQMFGVDVLLDDSVMFTKLSVALSCVFITIWASIYVFWVTDLVDYKGKPFTYWSVFILVFLLSIPFVHVVLIGFIFFLLVMLIGKIREEWS